MLNPSVGQRNYDVSLPHNKIPDALASLAKNMAIPAMPSGEEFKPEAAIVNYYGPSMYILSLKIVKMPFIDIFFGNVFKSCSFMLLFISVLKY